MSDLIRRAHKARTLAGDTSVPKWQRLPDALEALSGLELTEIRPDVWEPFEAALARINGVIDQYPEEVAKDYRNIDDDDLQEMLDILAIATSRAIDAELDRIMADLDAGIEELPVEAIQEAREHRDLMVPRLIEAIREATSAARQRDATKGNAHFFALFLLTEFRAEEAFPAIIESISLPGDLPFDLFGDAVTSTLARVLALFAGERLELIDGLIDDTALNEYVRWEAAQSYGCLVRGGRLDRDEAVRRLQQRLRHAIDREDAAVIGCLVCELVSYAPEEAIANIREAYARDLVDTSLVGLGTVERSIAAGETWAQEELGRYPLPGIDDTIEVLQGWASFEKPEEQPPPPPAPRPVPPPPLLAISTDELLPAPATIRSSGDRVGRNQPCPCGSGKKFKKCCGTRR